MRLIIAIIWRGVFNLKYVTLNNGIKMPQLGLGVYQIDNAEIKDVVLHAYNAGYRLIDTAQYYNNEAGIGDAIKSGKLKRENIFLTTKVWNSHHGYEKTLEAFSESMEKLGVDYIDLYLVHWPAPKFNLYVETYKALEQLYKDGKVKAIGVSNFDIDHLEDILNECDIKPVVNQVECHPYFQQKEMKAFCTENDIYVEAWSPLYRTEDILNEPVIKELAQKYGKTGVQIILRWHIQENTIVIPKSKTPARIRENIDVFDFSLSEEDMDLMRRLDRNKRRGRTPKEMHLT